MPMSTNEMRLIFQGDIRPVLRDFSSLMSVRFCFLSPDGQELQVGLDKPHSRFCRLVRHRLKHTAECHACDRRGWQQASRSGDAVWYRCHAGMMDGCMAVRSGERLLGYMMIGQFRSAKTCTPALRKRWRRQYGDDRLQAAFLEAPFYGRRKVRDIMGVFSVLVKFIISQRLVALRGLDPIQPLLTYLKEHPKQALTTEDAARLVHRSKSSLHHLFKRAVGKSFLRYQIETRLDLADEIFRTREGVTVREVAFELGYTDPYYFSRVYKKHRGYPPSEMLRRKRG